AVPTCSTCIPSLHDALPILVLDFAQVIVTGTPLPRSQRPTPWSRPTSSLPTTRGQRPPDRTRDVSRGDAHGPRPGETAMVDRAQDRKSTRLNSSHVSVSYAA